MTEFFDRRLVLVMGKGGVGRTTTAIALGHAAACLGRKVAVVELNGLGDVPARFGLGEASYRPRPLSQGVDTLSVSAVGCLEDFGRRKLRIPKLPQLLFQSRVASAFLDAIPGLQDLLQLGKIRNLLLDPAPGEPRYDLLILDAPATGHGLTLLSAARSMAEITRVGRFFEEAHLIEGLLADPGMTGLVLTTLPEVLPVNEALELIAQLGRFRQSVAALVVNQVRASPVPASPPWPEVCEALRQRSSVDLDPLVEMVDGALARHAEQRAALDRLAAVGSGDLQRTIPCLELPRLTQPPSKTDLIVMGTRLASQLTGGT